ncbi:hypothetical protein INR49_010711 [Caranx melampygus]|nr:hypothetical protein INR49_010711 [Caranx melampygus]
MLRSAFSLQISVDAHTLSHTHALGFGFTHCRSRERLCIERGNPSVCIFTGSAGDTCFHPPTVKIHARRHTSTCQSIRAQERKETAAPLSAKVWSLKLEEEVEKNKALTEALQTLATEHDELKQSLSKSRRSSSTLSTVTKDDFYDAESESDSDLSVSGFLSVASYSCEEDEGRDTPFTAASTIPVHTGGLPECQGRVTMETNQPSTMESRSTETLYRLPCSPGMTSVSGVS